MVLPSTGCFLKVLKFKVYILESCTYVNVIGDPYVAPRGRLSECVDGVCALCWSGDLNKQFYFSKQHCQGKEKHNISRLPLALPAGVFILFPIMDYKGLKSAVSVFPLLRALSPLLCFLHYYQSDTNTQYVLFNNSRSITVLIF